LFDNIADLLIANRKAHDIRFENAFENPPHGIELHPGVNNFVETEKKKILITTGAFDGKYHEIGNRIKMVLEQQGIESRVIHTGGSIENVGLLLQRPCLAIVQYDIALASYWGAPELFYKDKSITDEVTIPEVRCMRRIATLHTEKVHIFMRRDKLIDQDPVVQSLKGSRVCLGQVDSGTSVIAKAVLAHHGIQIKSAALLSVPDMVMRIQNSEIDAGFFVSFVPNKSIRPLLDNENIRLLSVDPKKVTNLIGPAIHASKIPPGVYTCQKENNPDSWRFWYYIMDLTYTVIDSIKPANGFPLDHHEFLAFGTGEDRRYWLIGHDERQIDMSELVENGNPDAVVIGKAIQELDSNGDIIWEWLSLDHTDEIPITDAAECCDLTSDNIDYLHTNAIEIDIEGNVLLSNRNLSEITKINYETQEVVWRWGGGPGNMFDFVDDLTNGDSAFNMQHDLRCLENGYISLFDNGYRHESPKSIAKIYDLDEDNLTATLVWSYMQNPSTISYLQGGFRVLENGNNLICWGFNKTSEIFTTEVSENGDVEWQIRIPRLQHNIEVFDYRNYRSTMLGAAARPYLCEEQEYGTLTLYCNWFGHEEEVAAYNVYRGDSPEPEELFGVTDTGIFETNDLLFDTPYYFRIKAVDQDSLEISGFSNEIEIYLDSEDVEDDNQSKPKEFVVYQSYPNPFNSSTNIMVYLPQTIRIKIDVFNVLGEKVKSLYNGIMSAGNHETTFDAGDLAGGIYFVNVNIPGKRNSINKIVLLK
ncbi:arylsulfotransferase family protein, partial [Calditrichota bacterium]